MRKNKIMRLLVLFVFLSSVAFGQSKKKQIEILNLKVDSLKSIFNEEVQKNIDLLLKIKECKENNEFYQNELNEQREAFNRLTDDFNNKERIIKKNKGKIEFLSNTNKRLNSKLLSYERKIDSLISLKNDIKPVVKKEVKININEAGKIAWEYIKKENCEYDCKYVAAKKNYILDYGKCYTIIVEAKIQNQYGAYKTTFFGALFDKNGIWNGGHKKYGKIPNKKTFEECINESKQMVKIRSSWIESANGQYLGNESKPKCD